MYESATIKTYERWQESLPLCLQEILRANGLDAPYQDLMVACGHGLLPVAVAGDPDPAYWAYAGRDLFLPEAAAAFGIQLRDMHPPRAATGLAGSPEYVQHFADSYRPLILRALHNGQTVLAWQGWGSGLEYRWGIITAENPDEGAGLSGTLPGFADDAPVVSPPVQCYVVETVAPRKPDDKELMSLALRHAVAVCEGRCDAAGSLLIGTAALAAWRTLSGRTPDALGGAQSGWLLYARSLRTNLDCLAAFVRVAGPDILGKEATEDLRIALGKLQQDERYAPWLGEAETPKSEPRHAERAVGSSEASLEALARTMRAAADLLA